MVRRVTWIEGSHTLKAGVDITRQRAKADIATHVNGNYTFAGANVPGDFRRTLFAGYVQNDWRITPQLTLNVGVRYELNQVPAEVNGLTPLFDPTYAANRPDLPIGKLDRRTLYANDTNNLGPRLGLSWRPTGRSSTVVRAGYGWYYSNTALMNRLRNSVTGPPSQLWPTYQSEISRPTLTWTGLAGVPPDQALRTALFGVLTGPEGQWLDGYTQQWSLSVARTFGSDYIVEGQYMGSSSTHLPSGWDYNYASPSPAALQPRLMFPKWGRVRGWNSGGSANYHALMLTGEKRFSRGLAFKGAYTFRKAIGSGGARERGGDYPHVQIQPMLAWKEA